MFLFHRQALCGLVLALFLPAAIAAQDEETQDWDVKLQSTYVWQRKPAFSARYSGPNSLGTGRERSYSFSATAALGVRPWQGGEVYLNPELGQGVPLSSLTGLGGFTNGEIARTSGPNPKVYLARLFLRQTWNLGGTTAFAESDTNRLAGPVDSHRLVLTAGTLSVLDLFDQNRYNHDPRTQFLNWALFTHGAYDFAADARGYTRGLALEYFQGDWAVRAGRFMQPQQPNQQALDSRLLKHFGDQIEIEHGHTLGGLDGRVRLLAYQTRARMARFSDAVALGTQTGTTPDINAVRTNDQTKYGFGINLEQALGRDLGLFARAMRSDGQTETYAYAEIDQSASLGLLLKGRAWGRTDDTVGLGLARNQLSAARRAYLAAGGISFFIGDGQLNYRSEQIAEAFYSAQVGRGAWVTLDAQYLRNPAYNADRGPVRVASVRLHAEF